MEEILSAESDSTSSKGKNKKINRKRKRDTDKNEELEIRPLKKRKFNDNSAKAIKNALKQEILNTYNNYTGEEIQSLGKLTIGNVITAYRESPTGKTIGNRNPILDKILNEMAKKKLRSIQFVTTMEDVLDDNGKLILDEKGQNKKKRVKKQVKKVVECDYLTGENKDLNLLQAELWINQYCCQSDGKFKINIIYFRELTSAVQEEVVNIGFSKYRMDVSSVMSDLHIPKGVEYLRKALDHLGHLGIKNLQLNVEKLENK